MKTWHHILLGVILGLIIGAAIYLVAAPPKGVPVFLQAAPTPSPLMIDINGAVKSPGLYALPRDSRLQDAIVAAGGYNHTADLTKINLARFIIDGEKIYIPEIGELSSVPSGEDTPQNKAPSIVFPLNLNTASAVELEMLPGIGSARAMDIIQYREDNGGFHTIEDLQKVPGIGPGIFENLRSLITVDG